MKFYIKSFFFSAVLSIVFLSDLFGQQVTFLDKDGEKVVFREAVINTNEINVLNYHLAFYDGVIIGSIGAVNELRDNIRFIRITYQDYNSQNFGIPTAKLMDQYPPTNEVMKDQDGDEFVIAVNAIDLDSDIDEEWVQSHKTGAIARARFLNVVDHYVYKNYSF